MRLNLSSSPQSGPRRHQGPMKRESFSASCSTSSLLTVEDPPGFTVSFQSVQWSTLPPSGRYLHRATRSAWTPAKIWLCSCQLERERHREIQVCLLQFSFHLKITVDAHISDITSCCSFSWSHTQKCGWQSKFAIEWMIWGCHRLFLCAKSNFSVSYRPPVPVDTSCRYQRKHN